MILNFIIFVLVCIGFTTIVNKSKLFKPIREYFCKISPNFLGYWISCSMCFGFAVGFLLSIIWYSPANNVNHTDIYQILDGFLSSICCYTYCFLFELLDKK